MLIPVPPQIRTSRGKNTEEEAKMVFFVHLFQSMPRKDHQTVFRRAARLTTLPIPPSCVSYIVLHVLLLSSVVKVLSDG